MISVRQDEYIGKNIADTLAILGAHVSLVLHNTQLGVLILVLSFIFTAVGEKKFAKYFSLILLSLFVLCFAPISTDIGIVNMSVLAAFLTVAVLLPLLIARFIYREKVIQFPIKGHTWSRGHIAYLLLAAVLSYLLLPLWMATTGEYENWTVNLTTLDISLLFIGTNALGIWDELFFIITVLALLRKIMPFWLANLVQASFFTIFLYDLGFHGWAPLAIYPFALLQGIVFKKTENLIYVIAIHLTIDLVLFLALINAHHPQILDIFITS